MPVGPFVEVTDPHAESVVNNLWVRRNEYCEIHECVACELTEVTSEDS